MVVYIFCGKKYIDLIDPESEDEITCKYVENFYKLPDANYKYMGNGLIYCHCCRKSIHSGYFKLHDRSKKHK